MKVFLQQHATQLWLHRSGEWEESFADARPFDTGMEAIQCSDQTEVEDVRVCFRFDDSKLNFDLHDEMPMTPLGPFLRGGKPCKAVRGMSG